MESLLSDIRSCTLCAEHLPLGPNPVMAASAQSKIAIIGQAPGTRVHASGIPWNDASGKTLRAWLNVSEEDFYNSSHFAIIPMGFCYPGKGTSGDLPPRPECAPQWHAKLFEHIGNIEPTLLIGQYSQRYYLGERAMANLTETVRHFADYLPRYFPLPHPSPRNRIWMKKNPWFAETALPRLRTLVGELIP